MSSINRRFFILGFLLIFSTSTIFAGTLQNNFLSGAAFGNFAKTSITTEKGDYLRGETVSFTGQGFGKYEDVSLSIETYSDSLRENIPLMRWNVYANAKGSFTASISFDSLSSENGKYIIRAVGSKTGSTAETTFENAVMAVGVDIQQCANGPLSAPIPCNTSGSNQGYGRGNLVPSKSHYKEGDFVPIRIVGTGLTVGQSYTITIGYDFTKGGKFATDYLGDYDYTESVDNNPCVDVAGCNLASETTFAIPLDPQVKAGFDAVDGTLDDITQIPGSFSCFGCTITAASGYTLSGSVAGDSSKFITLTLTADQANAVIAYGSHISTRRDWGVNNSAINISGSPYHNYIVDFPGSNQGNRDLQLSAEAVIFPATIVIIKDAQPNSCLDFSFSMTGQVAKNFQLDDDEGLGCTDNFISNTNTTNDLLLFGATNRVTVTEGAGTGSFNLTAINCTSFAGGATGTVNNNTTNLLARSATIELEEGEVVTCTFVNSITTAANVSVAGLVSDSIGTPISRAAVTLQNLSSGETQTVYTNSFGNYRFNGIASGESYIVTVSHKRYTFSNNSQIFTLNDAVENLNFVAD